jgi:hypothetical protein
MVYWGNLREREELERLVPDIIWILKVGREGLDWTYVARDRDKWRKKAGGEGLDWIYVAHDRDKWRAIVNTVMYILVSQNSDSLLTIRITISFSRRTVLHGDC